MNTADAVKQMSNIAQDLRTSSVYMGESLKRLLDDVKRVRDGEYGALPLAATSKLNQVAIKIGTMLSGGE